MNWAVPATRETVIHSIRASGMAKVESISLLGSEGNLKFQQQSDGLHVQLPETPASSYAYAFKIILHQ